jgi:hypothetical protein
MKKINEDGTVERMPIKMTDKQCENFISLIDESKKNKHDFSWLTKGAKKYKEDEVENL